MLFNLLSNLPSSIDLQFEINKLWIQENSNPVELKGDTLDLSGMPNLFAGEESLQKLLSLISKSYFKVLKLDLSSLSIAIADQLI